MKSRKPEPAEIEFKSMRFLITDRPTDANIDKYVEVGRAVDAEHKFDVHNVNWYSYVKSDLHVGIIS